MNLVYLKELNYYCTEKENQFFDRKSARIKPLDILKHLVAFANAQGGQLVLGIEDDGKISGFNCSGAHSIDEYRNILLTELKETPFHSYFDVIEAENYKNEDDKIVVITVDFSPDRVIKSYDGKVYLRQNNRSCELNFEQILQLRYDKGQRYFEDEVVEGSGIQDIDNNLIADYKKIMNIENISTEEILKARNLISDSKLTNAGVLLFG